VDAKESADEAGGHSVKVATETTDMFLSRAHGIFVLFLVVSIAVLRF